MIRQETWERLGELLEVRLAKGVFTTEDSVRYTFFIALLEREHLKPEDIILEHRHPGITSALIDTWIPALDGVGVALEFKYDRDIPSGKNSPRTQKAGKIFQDLYRLGQFNTTAHRVFVYLASDEMTSHFMSKRNRLSEFFSLAPGRSLRIDDAFLAGRAKSFVSMLGATPNVEAVALYARGLPHGHQVRAYEVHGFESLTSAPSTAELCC
jgi:hypothetical protein